MSVINSEKENYIQIDGNYGEGGGSILRLASAFSVLTQKPIRIYNIRKNRPVAGLRTQHLVGLRSLAKLSNGKLSEVKIGTTELTFQPGKVGSSTIDIYIQTAGSIGLVLQAIQMACINSNSEVRLNFSGGATFGKWAPSIPYLNNITFKILEKMGIYTNLIVHKEGFYPKGGANAQVIIKTPKQIKPINLSKLGSITEILGLSIASNNLRKNNVAERQAKTAKRMIKNALNINPEIATEYVNTLNPGSGICLWLKTDTGIVLGSDQVGEKNIKSEIVSKNCAKFLIDSYKNNATCDTFLSDQLIPFIAMAEGSSEFFTNRLTNHTKTNIWLIKQFLDREFLVEKKNNLVKIICK